MYKCFSIFGMWILTSSIWSIISDDMHIKLSIINIFGLNVGCVMIGIVLGSIADRKD